ncbi:hypothetical protein V8G54_022840 [Vigna mungo]|uniref:Uncharacterized protein n=1 Tax=Vigna mungo TaxID=3915 RepID=A0AAQ3RNM2_VIGMU
MFMPVTKAEGAKVTKPSKPASVKGESVKQIKTVDPKKEDDSDSDESDDELAGNDESDSDEGKKRQNESASKTPISSKKAKTATTPEKTGIIFTFLFHICLLYVYQCNLH